MMIERVKVSTLHLLTQYLKCILSDFYVELTIQNAYANQEQQYSFLSSYLEHVKHGTDMQWIHHTILILAEQLNILALDG